MRYALLLILTLCSSLANEPSNDSVPVFIEKFLANKATYNEKTFKGIRPQGFRADKDFKDLDYESLYLASYEEDGENYVIHFTVTPRVETRFKNTADLIKQIQDRYIIQYKVIHQKKVMIDGQPYIRDEVILKRLIPSS